MFTNTASLEAPRNGVLWVVQLLGSTLFLISGLAKLAGDEQMIQTVAAIGIGQWFRYATALIEFTSAILLLIPALSGLGALLLVPTMMGAVLTQLRYRRKFSSADRTSDYRERCRLGAKGNNDSIDLA
jgi:putative oxidoreductase